MRSAYIVALGALAGILAFGISSRVACLFNSNASLEGAVDDNKQPSSAGMASPITSVNIEDSSKIMREPVLTQASNAKKVEQTSPKESHGTGSDHRVELTATDFAVFDFFQHVETLDKALDCGLINPNHKVLDADQRKQFAVLLSKAQKDIDDADENRRRAMWKYVNALTEGARPIPVGESFADLKKRIELENPKWVQIFQTTNASGNGAYIVVNWGDSPDYDAARLLAGDRKLEVMRTLKAFFGD